jgi:hypothetical protein
MNRLLLSGLAALLMVSCTGREQNRKTTQNNDKVMRTDSLKQYGYNLNFLQKHIDVIELRSGNSSVAIVPAWQGRVMTSTSEGDLGYSFGWINHDLIASGKTLPHINPYGGEERLWLGPEGGQYSIFFKKGDKFVYDKWQTPAYLDTIPFEITAQTDSSVTFKHDVETENYSGTKFNLKIERQVTLLNYDQILSETGIDLMGLNGVAFRSDNRLTNTGTNEWKKETGLLSVWMLGMFNPSPSVIIVLPFKQGSEKDLGVPVNDNYFGKIAADRLRIKGNNIFFRADGKSRGKIGIPPLRATGTMGSYDSENNILTLLICRMPEEKADYVNSAWQIQENPYSGDALNSYNDGPLEDGSQMGPFYELETSSPAAELKPAGSIVHSQITIHITGDRKLLDKIAVKILGVSLDEIEKSFKE